MSDRRRRELADSFRLLLGDERWIGRDLLVGVVALVVWVAGTGAVVTQIDGVLDVSLGLAVGETPAPVAVATVAVLWLVVPTVAVVVRLRRRTLNLRGNVEQYYRFEHPAALLAPPALLVLAVGLAGVALGGFSWYVPFVMLPVGLFALVRTLAFSYRVYSFSHPLFVQACLALSTAALLASSLVAAATVTGRQPLVDRVLLTAGVPTWITGTVSVEGIDVSGVAVAATAPVVLATAYVLAQAAVGLGVRLAKPPVDRSEMRTGQRYPPFLPGATPVQTPANPSTAGDEAPATDDDTASADTASTDPAPVAGSDGTDDAADDGAAADIDDVSNTRVFTPPADDGDEEVDAGPGIGTGTTADGAGESRTTQRSDAVEDSSSSTDREHCTACGESFTVDTAVRFCPNCGAALSGE